MSSHLIRSDLIPVGSGYAILMAVLAVGLWSAGRRVRAGRPLTRHTGRRDRGWLAFLWHVLADALGGYLLLTAVVVLYYYLVARVGSNFLESAFSGSALLVGVSIPVFLACSWISLHRKSWRAGRAQGTGRAGPDEAESRPDGTRPPAA